MNSAAGLSPEFSTRSSAHAIVSPIAEKRAEELYQFKMTRLMRKADQEEAQKARLNRKAEQKKLFFQAQLVALKAPAQQPVTQPQDAENEITPEIKSLTAVFPEIALTHLIAIHKNKFLAENLSKLRKKRREKDITG